jgi:hypothetical protein
MLGKTKKARLKLTYEDVRCHFFLYSAGYRYIVYKFRKKHNLLSASKKEREHKIGLLGYMGLAPQIYDDIYKLAYEFGLPPLFVEKTMIYEVDVDNVEYVAMMRYWILPVYIATSGHELKEGFYIKISPNTSMETLKAAREYFHERFKDLNDSLDPKVKKIHPMERDKQPTDLRKKIIIFINIEKYLYKHFEEAGFIYKNKIVTDVILDASEDDDVKSVTENIDEEELIGHLTNVYRSMQKHYNIPSFQKLRKNSL